MKKHHLIKVYEIFQFLLATVFFLFLYIAAYEVYLNETSIETKIILEKKGGFQGRLDEVSKGDRFLVEFSSAINLRNIDNCFQVEPAIDYQIISAEKKAVRLEIGQNLKPETEYKLKVSNVKSFFGFAVQPVEEQFSAPKPPTLSSIYPTFGATDIDYYEKIKIQLDQYLDQDYSVEVVITPLTGFNANISNDRREIVIVPTAKLLKNQRYDILINLKHNNFVDFKKKIYQGFFVTRKPPFVVYNFDANGLPTRTEERKENIEPQIITGKYIDVDLSSQTMFLFEDSVERGAFKVSTGKRGMDTPQGTFSVIAKASRPWSKKYSLYMPWFIQFTNEGHGIHELPEWPGGYKEGANHLGIPVSHGCVRLGIGPAKLVYDFAEKGTPIIVHY